MVCVNALQQLTAVVPFLPLLAFHLAYLCFTDLAVLVELCGSGVVLDGHKTVRLGEALYTENHHSPDPCPSWVADLFGLFLLNVNYLKSIPLKILLLKNRYLDGCTLRQPLPASRHCCRSSQCVEQLSADPAACWRCWDVWVICNLFFNWTSCCCWMAEKSP